MSNTLIQKAETDIDYQEKLIEVAELSKHFGDVVAVNRISFNIPKNSGK